MAQANIIHNTQYLWIDFICIDQENHAERNEQVSTMHEIYMNTQEVLAWIGPEQPMYFYRNPVGVALHWFSLSSLRGLVLAAKSCRSERCFLQEVRKSDYWTRAWIIQEQLLARNVTVLLCDSSMCKQRLVKVRGMSSFEFFHGTWHDFTSMSAFMRRTLKRTPHRIPLVELLATYGDVKRSERRDRVYSLLAMSEEGRRIKVDYQKSCTQILLELLELNIERICLWLPLYLVCALGLSEEKELDIDFVD